MSTVKTYLVIVYQLEGDMIRATAYFGEEDTRRELEEVFLFGPPTRKEIHLAYELGEPLTEMQLIKLEYLKDMGICSNFYVRDEISHDQSY